MKEIASMGITHKKAFVEDIEKLFREVENLAYSLFSFDFVKECIPLHTCNRVEVYVVMEIETEERGRSEKFLKDFVKRKELPIPFDTIEFKGHEESILHLFRLASGIESMIIGEDQILGQIRDLYEDAKKKELIGEILDIAFGRAIRVGKRVRRETKINEGAVSIGSVAVDLAESLLGDLEEKAILVIGAGEMGTLVAKALAKRNVKAIYVANRTFSRAKMLVSEFGGYAVRFDELEAYMVISDVVISSTGAPHFIIKEDLVKEVARERGKKRKGKLVLIDIANPRDVEETVASIFNVELHTIDDLRGVSESNKEKRKKEIKKVERIIEEEMENLKNEYELKKAKEVLKVLYEKAERIRKEECLKAMNIINCIQEKNNKHSPNHKYKEVIDNLTHSIVYKILAEPTKEIKKAAKEDKKEKIEVIKDLFKLS